VAEHHHEDPILREIHELVSEILSVARFLVALLSPTGATTARLSTERPIMATTAVLTFVDATGTPISPPTGDGSGLVVTFESDNPTVTIGTATGSGNEATATITGTDAFNLSATVANTSGAPLLDNDGVTPFVQPSPIAVAASTPPPPPDQAITAVLSTE
jgi:hypothetical protein